MQTANDNLLINKKIVDNFNSIHNPVAKKLALKEFKKIIVLDRLQNQYNCKINESEQNIDNLLRAFCMRKKLASPKELHAYLTTHRISKEELRELLVYEEELNSLKEQLVSESDVKELFIERKHQYDSIMFSVIKVDDEQLANTIYKRITENNENFDELAKVYTRDENRVENPIVGPLPLTKISPLIRNALIFAPVGICQPPIKVNESDYLITKLIRYDKLDLNAKYANDLRSELFEKIIENQITLEETL